MQITTVLEQLHPSEMNSFKKCPRKYKYDDSLFDMRNSYHWDIFDAAWNSDWDLSPHINHFLKNMTSDAMLKWRVTKLQMRRYLEEGVKNIRADKARIKSKYNWYFQTKMFMRWGERIIVWTPDIYYYKPEEDLWIVMDCKWSSIWLYNNDETRISLQPPVYCRYVMEIHGVSTVKFAYYVVNKRTGDIKLESRTYTKEMCDAMIDECLSEYDYARTFDIYNPRESVQCRYCNIQNKCPLWKGREIISVEDIDELFL